ncbi:TRAP transporter small permease [Pacificibacter marinus]|uniref:TRAP transporter small permease protein n=1 Tax=Pacificibacter marinus TaxID=658057 RepID=A0A1Y5RRN1_9RHOB|nr:TRAP transporter small permease [Pacificibacter marinus]SEK43184.1 TRAP-type C4-dicarboxylate transport system, small permease component [Pacificibacter marinus]SLN23804.1 Tripartite ATP-independent periplasmic transporters, DctQ component [Pacificibacter marinus]
MQQFMKKVARVMAILARTSLWLAGLGLVLMTVFIAYQVFGRFVLNNTPTWTESWSVLIMGWFIFLGAAVGTREGYHLSFDVLLYVLPKRVKDVLHTISDIVITGFGIGMIVYGAQLAEKTWQSTIPNIGISGGWAFVSIIMGGVLMVLFSIERILRRSCGMVTARFGETELPLEDR